MYYTKDSKVRLSVGYALMVGVESVIWLRQIPAVICSTYVHSDMFMILVGVLGYEAMPRGVHVNLFTDYYQWMMIFALPLMCLYNGERGKYHKLFYYIFYPLHRTVLLVIEAILLYL